MAATDSAKVTDVNNVESYYKTTRIENLTTPDHVINFKNAPSLVIDEVKGWECFGVDGIIGSDLFANTIVTIDSQAKNIIVTSAEKPSTVSLRKMLNFTKGGGMPIVSIQIAPVSNINVLFDTGSPSLLSLIESDFEKNQTGSLYGSGFRRVWRREYRSIRPGGQSFFLQGSYSIAISRSHQIP